MTNYAPQASASDRVEAARKWLDNFAAQDAAERVCWHDMPEDFEDFLAIVRALVTPPSVGESVEEIADAIQAPHRSNSGELNLVIRSAITRGVHAGIAAAQEAWEPETALRPSQEQMLRWLGIEHRAWDHVITISAQIIEREVE